MVGRDHSGKGSRFFGYIRATGHEVQKAAGHKIVCRSRGGPKGATTRCPAAFFTRSYDYTGLFPPNVLLCFAPETFGQGGVSGVLPSNRAAFPVRVRAIE